MREPEVRELCSQDNQLRVDRGRADSGSGRWRETVLSDTEPGKTRLLITFYLNYDYDLDY